MTGQDPGEVGDRVQNFVEDYTDDPERLIGPITSIGVNVAGVLGALILILITAYYMAVRPEPLRERHVEPVHARAARARAPRADENAARAWIGWMQGVAHRHAGHVRAAVDRA